MLGNYFCKKCIVKSQRMKDKLKVKDSSVIPNGVDTDIFKPIDKRNAIEKLGWDKNKKHILFAANPLRKEKNFALAKKSFLKIDINDDFLLQSLNNVSFDKMVYYYNAADVVLLTSIYEGSPNVIKEALSCNKPVVCTNVGDVESYFSNTEGCFISDHNVTDISNNLLLAASCDNSNGRDIIKNKLSNTRIAEKLHQLYINSI